METSSIDRSNGFYDSFKRHLIGYRDVTNECIHKISITCEDGVFDGSIELRVHDREDVKSIINNLKAVADLKEISEIL